MLPATFSLSWSARAERLASSRSGSVGLVLFAITSIQTGASLAKSLFPVVGAQGAATLRLFFAALILLALFQPWRRRVEGRDWVSIAVYGASLGAMNLLFYLALRTVPLGLAVALEFTGPMAVSMFSSRRLIDFTWIGLAIAGLLLLLPIGRAASIDPAGAGFAVAAGACWALYMLFGQKAGNRHGMTATAWGMLIAALLVLPFGAFHAGRTLFTASVLPLALGVALLSSVLPYSAEMHALRRMPVRSFGILMSVEPVLAALSGLLWLHETLSAAQWFAIALIVAASVGTTVTQERGVPLAAAD